MLGLKIYQAETDIYATFMHPYKSCIKYTNPFIRVLGGTQYQWKLRTDAEMNRILSSPVRLSTLERSLKVSLCLE